MKIATSFRTFLTFLAKEMINPPNYIIAFFIGAIINKAQGHGFFDTLAPFVVPILVQAFSKASVNFQNREMELLLQLPGEKKDPAFIMDETGHIIASAGKTKSFFEKHGILNIQHIFGEQDLTKIIQPADKGGDVEDEFSELYSGISNKWYQVKTIFDKNTGYTLVWLDDISQRKHMDSSLATARMFNNEIINSIKTISRENDIYDRLAHMILLEGYRGIFIIKENEAGEFSGKIFKFSNKILEKSETIELDRNSAAPVLASRISKRIISKSIEAFDSEEAFEKAHPFDKRVKGFLGFRINNFINYHEGDVSIIAFNKSEVRGKHDQYIFEAIANTARTTTYLIDLSLSNEEKFLQIITGLASASEYSDELTGKHILRVNRYSSLISKHLGCDAERVEIIGQVAALHDIGKVAIPDIIKLQRKLTDAEIEKMRMHPIFGAQIFEQMISRASRSDLRLGMARDISLNHHQCWNGTGYPGIVTASGEVADLKSKSPSYYSNLRPLIGDEIPIEAIIVSLADKYDALRSARQYKPAFSHEKTTKILSKDELTGKNGEDVFGPKLFQLYLDIHEKLDEVFNEMRDS
jgi:response regulator RpfG family c-di-GMP phosphodiesterase